MDPHFEFTNTNEDEFHVTPKEIDLAFAKANKILSNPINPEDFRYDNVTKDIEYVKKREAEFLANQAKETPEETKARKLGRIFEAIIFEQSEQNNWLGENARTIETSRYDDIVHGVDAVVEFTEGPASASHLALAMDVTTSGWVSDKFEQIKRSIDKGELTQIKYFVSESLNFRGEKTLVPHVVIGVDKKTLYQVVSLWVKGKETELARHPVQIKLLEEMRSQLKSFSAYAKSIDKAKVVEVYNRTLGIVEGIIAAKGISEADLKEARRDDVVYAIERNAEHIADRKAS